MSHKTFLRPKALFQLSLVLYLLALGLWLQYGPAWQLSRVPGQEGLVLLQREEPRLPASVTLTGTLPISNGGYGNIHNLTGNVTGWFHETSATSSMLTGDVTMGSAPHMITLEVSPDGTFHLPPSLTLIAHGNGTVSLGFSSQYCHPQKEGEQVRPEAEVAAREPLPQHVGHAVMAWPNSASVVTTLECTPERCGYGSVTGFYEPLAVGGLGTGMSSLRASNLVQWSTTTYANGQE